MEVVMYGFAFACMIGAMIYRFTWGLRKSPGQTRKTQIVMLSLLGSGLLTVGMVSFVDMLLSKPVVAEGWVAKLRTTNGKNAHSSFMLITTEGAAVWLSVDYIGPRLANGERIRVTYRDRTADVTELNVLDGANAGWSDKEHPGVFNTFLCLGLGTFMLASAYRIFRKPVVPPLDFSVAQPGPSPDPGDQNRL